MNKKTLLVALSVGLFTIALVVYGQVVTPTVFPAVKLLNVTTGRFLMSDANGVTTNSAAATGTGGPVLANSPTITTPSLLGNVPASGYINALGFSSTNSFVNVKAPPYNATGLGSADDYLAIQSAVNSGAKMIYIPPGTFKVGQAIALPSNVILQGAGASSILTLANGANCDVIKNADWWAGNTNIVVRDLFIDGNRANQSSAVGDGPGQSLITLVNVKGALVENIKGKSPWLHGIDMAVPDISDNSKGIIRYSGVITGTFSPSQSLTGSVSLATATLVTSTNSGYLVIDAVSGTFQSGETIASASGSVTSSGTFVTSGCEDIVIHGCEFWDFGDDGISPHWSKRVTISQCITHDAAASYSASSNGIELDDGSSEILVSGCISYRNVAGYMIQGHDGRTPSRMASIVNSLSYSNNTAFNLNHVNSDTSTKPAPENIAILGCTSISDNVFIGNTGYKSIAVVGCLVKDTGFDFGGLYITPGATTNSLNILFSDTVFDNAPISLLNGGHGITFDNCEFKNSRTTFANLRLSRNGIRVKNSRIHSGGGPGFWIEGGSDCDFSGNQVWHNGSYGFRIDGGTNHFYRNNTIFDNTTEGMRISGGTNSFISGNRIFNSGSGLKTQNYAIRFATTNQVLVTGNDVTGNALAPYVYTSTAVTNVLFAGNVGESADPASWKVSGFVNAASTNPIVNISGTLNTSGNTYGLLQNITNTASGSASRHAGFLTAGVPKAEVGLAGDFLTYNTWASPTDYERGYLRWSGNALLIGSDNSGSGTARAVLVRSADSLLFQTVGANTRWRINNSGHWVAEGSAQYDISGVRTNSARQFFVTGTTNQVIYGSTNTAPVDPGTIVRWISVQVSGESDEYRTPLYK